ncbi:unnamed protein product [Penicillium camemberti]|uniref:Str. FM013 n=1 Tax=Penicillium camemberti (strain FM 013) TaxID=1429867 RepID=A0A0G4PQT3_PENC3|nr:unnamed protein product [Penicillium camemberti]
MGDQSVLIYWRALVFMGKLADPWIITLSVLSLVIIYPYGNLKAVDAYFFGASASAESGLNTVDVKFLETYQQIYIYLILILGNLGFINMICYIDQASFLIWQRDSFCFRLFVLVDSKGLFNSDCFRLLYIKDLALGFSSTPHLW